MSGNMGILDDMASCEAGEDLEVPGMNGDDANAEWKKSRFETDLELLMEEVEVLRAEDISRLEVGVKVKVGVLVVSGSKDFLVSILGISSFSSSRRFSSHLRICHSFLSTSEVCLTSKCLENMCLLLVRKKHSLQT